jgi:hypothetical protein
MIGVTREARIDAMCGRNLRRVALAAIAILFVSFPDESPAYPVDAAERTGIRRLEAYDVASRGESRGKVIPLGALLSEEKVQLRLIDQPAFVLPSADPDLTNALRAFLGGDASRYGIAFLDMSDPTRPRYAEINGAMNQSPGSVGKILVALAVFQELADAHPADLDARRRVLRETQVVADDFIRNDDHLVPVYTPVQGDVAGDLGHRPVMEGDSANLWTWLDWMLSASSNAAASVVMREMLLLAQFGAAYPVDAATAARFFATTPKSELSRLLRETMDGAARRSGIDTSRLRQGTFFTRAGKEKVPGGHSAATARELMHYVVLMEQGKLVDPFSSLEIKKLLYLTEPRLRYSSAPELDNAAVYFKSGSLYSCQPEKGYACGKYLGNRWNFMSSLAIVEGFAYAPPINYAVVVLSNVLKKNSSDVHRDLAGEIHRFIVSFYGTRLVPEALAPPRPAIATTPASAPRPAPPPARAPTPPERRAVRR